MKMGGFLMPKATITGQRAEKHLDPFAYWTLALPPSAVSHDAV
jgi:hypothetical protein